MVFTARSNDDRNDLLRGSLPTVSDARGTPDAITKEAAAIPLKATASLGPLAGITPLAESGSILSNLTPPGKGHLDEPARLSPEAIKDLAALKSTFKVRVLRGPGEEGNQLVVLQGEAHAFNSDKTIGKFKDVIRHFKRFGYEGVEVDKYLAAGKFFKYMDELSGAGCKVMGLNDQGSMDIARDAEDDFNRAQIAKHSRPLEESIRLDLLAVKDGIWTVDEGLLDSLKPEQYGVSQSELDDAVVRVRSELANPDLIPVIEQAHSYHLEAGHKPDMIEQFNMVKDSMWVGAAKLFIERPLLGIAAGIGYIGVLTQLPPVVVATAACLHLAAGWYAGSHSLSKRDKTMATNIDEICKSKPSEEPMLAQMGDAHVNGVAKNLIQRGWREEHPFG